MELQFHILGIFHSLDRSIDLLRDKVQLSALQGISLPACQYKIGIIQRCSDCILVVHKGQCAGVYYQVLVPTDGFQLPSRDRILLFRRSILRQCEHIKIGGTVRRNEHIRCSLVEAKTLNKNVAFNSIQQFDGSYQFGHGQEGVVLCAFLGIDQQNILDRQSEIRESGEESQIDFADLVLAGYVLRSRLPGNRRQTLGREDDVDSHANDYHYRQHQPQKRPSYDLECAFHSVLLFSEVFLFILEVLRIEGHLGSGQRHHDVLLRDIRPAVVHHMHLQEVLFVQVVLEPAITMVHQIFLFDIINAPFASPEIVGFVSRLCSKAHMVRRSIFHPFSLEVREVEFFLSFFTTNEADAYDGNECHIQ